MADVIALGDRVEINCSPDGTGTIEAVQDRKRALVRTAPTARGPYQQVLLANLDQLVLVFSCESPKPWLEMLDRFLVICEKQEIPPLIIANKIDLVGIDSAQNAFLDYPTLGYPVFFTSTVTGEGVEEFRQHLVGRISGLVGQSGTGKSSLLNAVQPDLGLAVRAISEWSNEGRHTTVVRAMFPLNGGGHVADLPGIRNLDLWDIEPEELDGYFPEIRDRVQDCQFNDCSHQDEPGCAVLAAVDSGEISAARYKSYSRLRGGE
jgi:ribosome biogenesis GTPase